MNCTVDGSDDFKSEHNKNLENILSSLQNKLDEKNIVLSNLKNQFALLKENENKYLQEINDLQSNEEDEVKSVKKRDQIKSLQNELKYTEESFDLELFKAVEEIFNLEEELANLPNPEVNEEVEENEEELLETLFKESLDLEIQLEKLNDDRDGTKLKLKDMQKANEELSNYIENINSEFEHRQQSLHFKSEEVTDAYKLLREMEEQCRLTNNELKCLSDTPQNVVDEGSIFSEVNNRRLGLKECISKMEIDSKNMINKKLNIQKKLSKFRSNHQKLESLLRSEVKDIQYDNECLFVYYRSRNDILEELVHIYSRIINEKLMLISEGFPCDGFGYLHKYVDDIEKVIKQWRESENTRRLSLFMISSDLRDSSLKLNEEQNRTLQLENKVVELETNIANFNCKEKENIKPASCEQNITHNVPESSLILDKKEKKDVTIEKKVAFAANILEPKRSDNHRVKRGKILKIQTMHID